jgi:hypothetical protein
MLKERLPAIVIVLATIFGLGLLLGVFLPHILGTSSSPRTYNTAVVLKQVQTLSELITVKYVMEKVEVLADPPENPIRRMLPDDSHVILVAHGIVKAGVDLAQLKPEDLSVSGKKIVVSLPPAHITDAYLDDKQTQVVERNTGFLREFNKDLEQTARKNAVDDIRHAARTSGILQEADQRAQLQLKSLFLQLGFQQVEFRPAKK